MIIQCHFTHFKEPPFHVNLIIGCHQLHIPYHVCLQQHIQFLYLLLHLQYFLHIHQLLFLLNSPKLHLHFHPFFWQGSHIGSIVSARCLFRPRDGSLGWQLKAALISPKKGASTWEVEKDCLLVYEKWFNAYILAWDGVACENWWEKLSQIMWKKVYDLENNTPSGPMFRVSTNPWHWTLNWWRYLQPNVGLVARERGNQSKGWCLDGHNQCWPRHSFQGLG